MAITATQVKDLREKTGAGMMDAKKALEDADGDMEKAMEILRQRGVATAEKKSGRATAEGLVEALIAPDKKLGVLVEVNCETDFVAKGEAFQAAVQEVAQKLFDKEPASLDAFLADTKEFIAEKIGVIKENINVRRFERYQLDSHGAAHAYIHTGGKIGVLVDFSTGKPDTINKPEFQQLIKDVAMQIASFAPEFVTRDDIGADVIDAETRIEMGKEDIQSKPEEIRAKIVTGRVNKLLGERVLVEQAFVKDPSKTIGDLLSEQSKALGDTVAVKRFTRYVLGEGIEKKQANFAEEVAAAARG